MKEFVESPLVKELQERLLKRAEGRDSWLSEWWNETAYFGWRGPIVPGKRTFLILTQPRCTDKLEMTGVNYFYSHKDDKSRRSGPARAAALTRALLFFRRLTIT